MGIKSIMPLFFYNFALDFTKKLKKNNNNHINYMI